MKINSNAVNAVEKEISIQKMFDFLLEECDDVSVKNERNWLIAWLPNISSINVAYLLEDSYIDVQFTNSEVIRLYNTGLEYLLATLSEKEK